MNHGGLGAPQLTVVNKKLQTASPFIAKSAKSLRTPRDGLNKLLKNLSRSRFVLDASAARDLGRG